MSDFQRAYDEQVAREAAQEQQRSELVARGRANVDAFIALMSQQGVEPVRLRTRLRIGLRVQQVLRRARDVAEGSDPPERGWSARHIRDDPRNRLSHYILEDGQVIDVTGDEPRFVSEDALADAEPLAVHARSILTSGNAHHGERERD